MAVIVKAIIPDKFRIEAVRQVLESENRKYAPFIVKDFEKTTAGWAGEKPKFIARVTAGLAEMKIVVAKTGSTKGVQKWDWLDQGTKPHAIYPRRAKRLRFQTGYSAGSRPGSLNTYRSSRSGPTVYAKAVMHPGTVERGWTKLIRDMHEKPYASWMDAAMKQAAKASGHYYG